MIQVKVICVLCNRETRVWIRNLSQQVKVTCSHCTATFNYKYQAEDKKCLDAKAATKFLSSS